ncbi:TetR/AcrR family transcriptional regulator [Kutzneria sp. CA-103260]|uniref:TetR/AcrR family transcriptional regulator n=1 Tax=Kutzneria sp. CA-103260 TaxID=2802641 RepID=UPI001BA6394C|nr:TetR/AcrR family transcriptional regulator [Kutzneria sp. CA-103260]QUQ70770.1 TetR family transcriptional regulator [Kutzneria sp. CA-103260]
MTRSGRTVRGLDAEQRRAQRRADLLAAALTLFGRKGFGAVPIEEICQTAYVGTKSFYELFDSKEACYLALFEQLTADLSARMQAALGEVDSIDGLLETLAQVLVADLRVPQVLFGQSAGVSPAVERRRRENRRWAAGFVEGVWRQYGVIGPDQDVRPIAIATIGGLFELIADWLFDGAEESDVLIARLTAYNRIVRAGLESTVDGVSSDR